MRKDTATRTFSGRTTKEVMNLIRRELGGDAVIFETRSTAANGSRPSTVEIIVAADPASGAAVLTPMPEKASTKHSNPDATQLLKRAFELNGVVPHLSAALLNHYHKLQPAGPGVDAKLLARAIAAGLRFCRHPKEKRRILALVGPTGVGKTTTIAKLATIDTLQGRSVGLITIDTHRIGAIEQLGKFASLIDLPMETASSAEELRDALARFSDKERIYIDTAGSGPKDEERMAELLSVLDCGIPFERMLLISASVNAPDLRRVVLAFRKAGVDKVGVTKIDETCHFGPCFSTLVEAGYPVEIFSNGPNVPEDVEYASPQRIVEMIAQVVH